MIKIISLGILTQAFVSIGYAQCPTHRDFWDRTIALEKNVNLDNKQKMDRLMAFKEEFEKCKLKQDSVYARILHRIGTYDYSLNQNKATQQAIHYTQMAVRINSSGKVGCSEPFLVNSYTNLGLYYESLGIYNVAIRYIDSAIIVRRNVYVPELTVPRLMKGKANMLYLLGDYQKTIDLIKIALTDVGRTEEKNLIISFLNLRAQAYLTLDLLNEATKDIDQAILLAKGIKKDDEVLNSMLIKRDILIKRKQYTNTVSLYKEVIRQRIKTGNYKQVADDYIDLGNFFYTEMNKYVEARKYYLKAVSYAKMSDNAERLAKAHVNLGNAYLNERNFKTAERYCIEAFRDLKIQGGSDILNNPTASNLSAIGNSELILVIMGAKAELLQQEFKATGYKNLLEACLQTALLTDTLITKIRHEQAEEQSKLYWRQWTRYFFATALEACYLANDKNAAFYFMEKSRAVLLNDKLNELNAAARLPATEAKKEQALKARLLLAQQKLEGLQKNTAEYERVLAGVLQEQDGLESYIKSLEKRYPTYYQYKYDDKTVTITELQQYLSLRQQSFIHYFMNDTLVYILGITPHSSRFIKLTKDNFDIKQIAAFNHHCNSESSGASDSSFKSFASLSFALFKNLFQPLHLPKGRVVVCPDNLVIPFEALTTDNEAKNFLINNFAFSYIYSARYLLNKPKTSAANGSFIGFAPVSFQPYLKMLDLKNGAVALRKVADHYDNSKLFVHKEATKHNFIRYLGDYRIVNIFSHANADTSGAEPLLFMQDSVIRLSELQLLKSAANLVVLSACQTNVGKNAKGEGIYSMARGFAAIGIPSVAAILWSADEKSTYELTESFHQYLSQGLSKDIALQKAKLDFIKANSNNKYSYPYYWANMIIIGDVEPIVLSSGSSDLTRYITGSIVVIGFVFIILFLKRRRIRHVGSN